MGFPIQKNNHRNKLYYQDIATKLKNLAKNVNVVDPVTSEKIIDTQGIIKGIFKTRRPILRYLP